MKTHFPEPALPPLVIVDDDDDDVFLLRHGLREGGITNPIAAFGAPQEGWAHLQSLAQRGVLPAIVFVEIRMPDDAGFELIARLRSRREWDNVRIVVVTSSNDPSDLERATRLRASGYLIKFPAPDILAEFVQHGPWFAIPGRQAELAAAV